MKKEKIFFLIALIVAAIPALLAQRVDYLQVKNSDFKEFEAAERYRFPGFIKAEAHLKDGTLARANFNYDNFAGVMRYIAGKDTLQVTNPEDVKYFVMGTDSFFWDKKYYEWVASTSKTRLYRTVLFEFKGVDAVGAYGTTSRNFSVSSINTLLENFKQDLDPNTVFNIEKITTYYIGHIGGKMIKATKSNISDMYPRKDVEDFIKEKKINLNKAEDLVVLLAFVNASEKKK
jgi:hypothetical protein